jgi:hypothetical protein
MLMGFSNNMEKVKHNFKLPESRRRKCLSVKGDGSMAELKRSMSSVGVKKYRFIFRFQEELKKLEW